MFVRSKKWIGATAVAASRSRIRSRPALRREFWWRSTRGPRSGEPNARLPPPAEERRGERCETGHAEPFDQTESVGCVKSHSRSDEPVLSVRLVRPFGLPSSCRAETFRSSSIWWRLATGPSRGFRHRTSQVFVGARPPGVVFRTLRGRLIGPPEGRLGVLLFSGPCGCGQRGVSGVVGVLLPVRLSACWLLARLSLRVVVRAG